MTFHWCVSYISFWSVLLPLLFPHHLKEAVFPFHPLLHHYSAVPVFFSFLSFFFFCHISTLPVPTKATWSNADFHLHMLFSLCPEYSSSSFLLRMLCSQLGWPSWAAPLQNLPEPSLLIAAFVSTLPIISSPPFCGVIISLVSVPASVPFHISPHPEMEGRDHVLPNFASLGVGTLPDM